MENQEYLNQISAKSKPVKGQGGSSKFDLNSILHSKYFLISAIGIVALIVIMILGSALGGGKKADIRVDILKFRLHLSSTTEVINNYQPKIKSSILRSHSASLKNVLENTNSKVENYYNPRYGDKATKEDEALIGEANATKDVLSNELFEAKINGNLDRVYAHKMAYEISLFLNEEDSLDKASKDDEFKAILAESYPSLENLYNSFNDFSETKNN